MCDKKSKLCLFILGKNEQFGLLDIVDQHFKHTVGVKCVSTSAEVYLWKREDLIHQGNQYKLVEALLRECKFMRERIADRFR